MLKTILFVLAILAMIVVGFVYLNSRPVHTPSILSDANKDDRCAEFRVVDEEDSDVYSLGYKGRIRQLLNGCF